MPLLNNKDNYEDSYEDRLKKAVWLFNDRKRGKYRPFGYVIWGSRKKPNVEGDREPKPYRANIWIPAPVEVRECCKLIKPPSSLFPLSYLDHCKSIKHVANLFNVKYDDLKIELKVHKVDGEFEKEVKRACLVKKRELKMNMKG